MRDGFYLEVNHVGWCSLNLFQWSSDVRVEHNEFQNDVISNMRNPFLLESVPGFNVDSVGDIVSDSVTELSDFLLVTLLFSSNSLRTETKIGYFTRKCLTLVARRTPDSWKFQAMILSANFPLTPLLL